MVKSPFFLCFLSRGHHFVSVPGPLCCNGHSCWRFRDRSPYGEHSALRPQQRLASGARVAGGICVSAVGRGPPKSWRRSVDFSASFMGILGSYSAKHRFFLGIEGQPLIRNPPPRGDGVNEATMKPFFKVLLGGQLSLCRVLFPTGCNHEARYQAITE